MSNLKFANNAQSSLAGSISNTALTANLQSGTGVLFPVVTTGSGNSFFGTFTDAATGLITEIVSVTNITGDTITMVRGQDNTSAKGWSANDLFAQLVTAGDLDNMVQLPELQAQAANYAVDTGSANAYLCALTPTVSTSPSAGFPVRIKWANANTGASTLNAGWGAVAIKRRDGSALIGNEIIANDIGEVIWNGSIFFLNSPAPATTAAVTAGTDTQSFITPASLPASNPPFTTGDVKLTLKVTADAGWVLFTDGTIGSASSGATYANADAQALYVLVWDNVADAYAPVTGGRGANGAADFAANKKMGLLTTLGRAMVVAGTGAGLSNWPLGFFAGDESVTLTTGNLPIVDSGVHGASTGGPVNGITTQTADPFFITQPSFALNIMVKL